MFNYFFSKIFSEISRSYQKGMLKYAKCSTIFDSTCFISIIAIVNWITLIYYKKGYGYKLTNIQQLDNKFNMKSLILP